MYFTISTLYRVGRKRTLGKIVRKLTELRYAGDRFGQPGEAKTVTVGLCTGLLAAAAVASSPSLPALIPLGVEVTLVAFRTGLCVATTARSLDLSQDKTASWSFIVAGTDDNEAQAIITAFHREKVCVSYQEHKIQALTIFPRKSQNQSMRTLALSVITL